MHNGHTSVGEALIYGVTEINRDAFVVILNKGFLEIAFRQVKLSKIN